MSGVEGPNMSRQGRYTSVHLDLGSINHLELSADVSEPGITSQLSSLWGSLADRWPLLRTNCISRINSTSTKASTRSSHSTSSSRPLVRTRSSSKASHSSSSLKTFPRSERRPGPIHVLGVFGLYRRNPCGLAGFYDWEAEEGGYVPFLHQKAHRKQWRREMCEAQEEEQRMRSAKIASLDEQKAARRRAYEEHMAQGQILLKSKAVE